MAEKYAQGVVLNSFQTRVTIFPIAVHSSSAGKASIASEGNQVVQLGKIDDYVPQSPDLFILKISGVFGKQKAQKIRQTPHNIQRTTISLLMGQLQNKTS